MTYLVAIDDTDMPGTKGTGWLVQELCELMEAKGLASSSPISRHQLFVHEDVPFTSHNSSMCFEMDLHSASLEDAKRFMISFLEEHAQDGSDPGLCIVNPSDHDDLAELHAYAQSAKTTVLSKTIAYDLAKKLGIYLSEHGGTGDGVVGALAGTGLRMLGNDGRYRGWYHLGNGGDVLSVGDIHTTLPFVDAVTTESGKILGYDTRVTISSEKIKAVRKNKQQVMIVVENDLPEAATEYRIISSREAKIY